MYDAFQKTLVKSERYFPCLAWFSQRRTELLVILFVLLLPFGEASHLPIAIFVFMSVKGIWGNGLCGDFDSRRFIWIAAALIVPLLISTIGAYDVYRTLRTVLVFTLYSIAGVYLIRHFRVQLDINFLLFGISGILLFWTADALLQYFHGTNIFGWPGRVDGITGMYGYKLWIGYTFAHLAPFLFESLRRWSTRPGFKLIWLLIIPFIMVIMLTGRRAAWVTLGLVSSIYIIWLVRRGDIKLRHVLAAFSVFCLAIGTAVVISPELQLRVQTTMKVFSGTWDSVNLAGANRLEVWRGAWLLYKESPLIGVGTHAYDPLVFERGYTISKYGHTHLYGLDVLLSTGVIGFVAFVAAFFYLCVKLVESIKLALPTLPAWLAAISIMFPLNVHWNFYAPRPASLFWMLIILAIAINARYRAKNGEL